MLSPYGSRLSGLACFATGCVIRPAEPLLTLGRGTRGMRTIANHSPKKQKPLAKAGPIPTKNVSKVASAGLGVEVLRPASTRNTLTSTAHDFAHQDSAQLGKSNAKLLSKVSRKSLSTSSKHHDLASYEEYAARVKLDRDSNGFRGTRYEYASVEGLPNFGMFLKRAGRRNDFGIDLRGEWHLPQSSVQVLGQCKLGRPTPAMIRELEGMQSGAPARFKGPRVILLLVSKGRATEGVRQAIRRSQKPLVFVQMTEDGKVQDILWNSAAGEAGLEGIGIHYTYPKRGASKANASSATLTWLGQLWQPGKLGRAGSQLSRNAEDSRDAETSLYHSLPD